MIDNGEALLASTGLTDAMDGVARPKGDGMPRMLLAAKLAAAARNFIAQKETEHAPTSSAFDYHKAHDKLSSFTETSPAVTHDLDADSSAEYVESVQRAAKYLRSVAPASSLRTMTGLEILDPDDMAAAKFKRAHDTVNDPMVALKALQDGSITKDHVDALAAVYPSLHGELREMLGDEAARRQAGDPLWALHHEKDAMLADLFGVHGPDEAAVTSVLQQTFASEGKHPAPPSHKPKAEQDLSTPTQRAANT